MSDYKGIWVPKKSYFVEGLVPEEGEFEFEIRELVRFAFKKKIPINLEVKDKDLEKLEETKRTLNYISRVLEG